VTLWPVENDAERAALEAFAFSLGQRLPRWEATPRVGFVPAPDHVVATWQAAARRLNDATTGWFVVTLVPGPDINGEGVIVSPFTTLADCNHGWYPWRYEAAGFCMQSGEEYFVAVARTDPARIATEGMALRVLLYSYGLRPHPLPGVLNATRPDDTLSDFELRTLHMIGLRARAAPLWWPDTEF